MSRHVRVALFAVAAALLWLGLGPTGHERRGSFAERVFAPGAHLAAAWSWTRFDAAWAEGDEARAWSHASRALRFAASDASAWTYLAHHAVYDRAAPRRGLPRQERERWVDVGLALLERGEREARDPGPVAFKLGVVWLSLASEEDDARARRVTRAEALRNAAEAFERAAAHGQPVAAEAARIARAEAEQAGG